MVKDRVETTRLSIGLSRPQMDKLMAGVDFPLVRVKEIEREYRLFISDIRRKLLAESKRPVVVFDDEPCLSTVQVSRATGIGEFHLTTFRQRGKLFAIEIPGRRYPVFRYSDIREFVDRPIGPREHHLPLAPVFIRWLQDKGIVAYEDPDDAEDREEEDAALAVSS